MNRPAHPQTMPDHLTPGHLTPDHLVPDQLVPDDLVAVRLGPDWAALAVLVGGAFAILAAAVAGWLAHGPRGVLGYVLVLLAVAFVAEHLRCATLRRRRTTRRARVSRPATSAGSSRVLGVRWHWTCPVCPIESGDVDTAAEAAALAATHDQLQHATRPTAHLVRRSIWDHDTPVPVGRATSRAAR